MKKVALLIFVCLFSIMMCVVTACTGTKPSDSDNSTSSDVGQSEVEEINFEKDYYSLEQFTSVTVRVPDFTGETVAYKSSDTKVATIDEDGLVYALTVGQTTITAECNGKTAACTVAVTKAKYTPILELEHDNVSLNMGDKFSMNVYATYNGEKLSEDIEYTVTLADGAAENIAEVTVLNGRVTINALAAGETEFYVSATIRGKYLNKSLTVKVLPAELRINLIMDDMKTDETGYVINIATVSGVFGEAELALSADIYEGRQKVDGATVTWTSRNENIVKIEERNGVSYVVAQKGGEGVIVGSCTYGEKTASVEVRVNVIKPIVALQTEEVPVISAYGAKADPANNKLTIDKSLIEGEFIRATVDGVVVSVSSEVVDDNVNITLDGDAFPKKTEQLGAMKMLIETDELRYELDIEVYSLVVKTEQDLMKISEIEAELKGEGYFILGNDIEMSGSSRTWFWYGDINHVIGYNQAFVGIIDGRGYKVSGFALEHADVHGFIHQFGAGGVLKNIAFIDAVFLNKGGFITNSAGGTLENVYIGVKKFDNVSQSNHGLFGPTWQSYKFTMKNVVIDYTEATINVEGKANTTLAGNFADGTQFTNVALIGIPETLKGTDYEGKGVKNYYISYTDGTDNGVSLPDSGWDEKYWTMKEGSIPSFGAYIQNSLTIDGVTVDLNVSVTDGVAAASTATVNVGSEVEDIAEAIVTVNGTKYVGSIENGVLSFNLPANVYGNKTFVVTGASGSTEYTIVINAFVVTKLIATEADLQSISAIETALGGDGYYQLAADITMSARGWYWPYGDAAVNYIIGLGHSFIGTIDGNGYKIIGLTLSEMYDVTTTSGFISQFGAGGVLKNIAFIDASFKHKAGLIQGGSSGSTGGVIENVYIGIKSYDSANQNGYGLFGPSYNNYTFTMKNVIVDYTGATISNIEGRTNVNLFGSFGYYTTFSNVAVIGVPTELSSYVGNIRAEWKDKVYIGYADGTTNGVAIPDSGWNETYWTMTAGSLPTFKSKEN